ncbi:MAG: hypothetical protein JXB48_00220 [Candidatus Latescibacteria bacterium]|nr:hypothetical protein [Candidatus Latescibacterota bacterium]
MKISTQEELSLFDGKNNNPPKSHIKERCSICPSVFLWRNAKHQFMHFADRDMTDDLENVPHGDDLLDKIPNISVMYAGEKEETKKVRNKVYLVPANSCFIFLNTFSVRLRTLNVS